MTARAALCTVGFATIVDYMNTTHRSRIAAEVRAAVARDGISRGDLAAKLNMNADVLSRKLNGSAPIGLDELASIARALNINPRKLIDTALAATAA